MTAQRATTSSLPALRFQLDEYQQPTHWQTVSGSIYFGSALSAEREFTCALTVLSR